MKLDPLRLGRIVGTRRTLALGEELRKDSHIHVVGATRTGKSKFLESLIRQDILNRRGLCLIDPHGTLAHDVLAYVSRQIYPPKRFHYIAPHRDDWTCIYNPLNRHPEDDSFLVEALKHAVLKCWGQSSSRDTPLIDQWLGILIRTGVSIGLTLPDLAMLLEPGVDRNLQRRAVAAQLPNSDTGIKAKWDQLCQLAEKRPVEFEIMVGGVSRRLSKFVDNPRLTRMYGVPGVSLDLAGLMDERGILIVDLSPKGRFYDEDAQLFGTLLLTDFFAQMFSRKNPEAGFCLYIDEFQKFATKDIAEMLDQSLKFGLQLCLAHQRPGQLQNSDKEDDRQICSAVNTNAKTKVVFGGVSPDEIEPIARILSMGELDPMKIKRKIYTTGVVDYQKEYWQAHSHSSGHTHSFGTGVSSGSASTSSSGYSHGLSSSFGAQGGAVGAPLFTNENQAWQNSFGTSTSHGEFSSESDADTETDGVTTFPVLVPQMGEQLSTVYYESLENQLYQFMAILYDQEQRHAIVRVVGQKAPLPIVTPFLPPVAATDKQIERQLALSYKGTPWFLPVAQATALVEQRKREFLALGSPAPGQPRAERDTLKTLPPMPETFTPSSPIIKVGNVELQARDLALLNDIFDSRFITIPHATVLHFAGISAAEASAKRRLAKLAKVELLEARTGNFGSAKIFGAEGPSTKEVKTLYCFTKKALDLLVEHGSLNKDASEDWDTKQRKRFEFGAIRPTTIAHEIGVLNIKAALQPAIAACAHLKIADFGVWPVEYEFKVQRGGHFPTQRPDGFLHVLEFSPNDPTPRHHYFYIEFDTGSETLDTIAEKVEGYRTHLRSGGFLQWLGLPDANVEEHPFRVLFVIDAKDATLRRNNMCERLISLGVETHTPLATIDDLIRDPLGAVWIVPKTYKTWLAQGKRGPISMISLFEGLEKPSSASA